MPTLANSPVSSILVWVIVLIGLLLAGTLLVFRLRRSMLANDAQGPDHAGLMDQMRRMVDQGQMTQEEFDKARRAIVERAAAKREKTDPS
jgi:uncharacterized membrane protein